ncbi:5'-nucleotidase/UDP-sugar diphosphatase [Chromobacterium alkanivorans]|uniref:bifunctional UDP-sugar hydrolase/5'-nucleotidase UshA n=1 Tax=Chromobacterium alkanivorans TaxID=1071719 RepID=UPI002168837D|nr:bifunctional UDP-sugar hydrolase/5'-nucleotidase UshA [Chromobacterium alkanivorans]MCS3804082.1 5'-nucleotidase/UDP-sugar diphosphatase [Chromobacterium alkanivorans]MCS3818697.1 5'-nucleotidase/UDP-sugar diphosphatase [Chromobacterium alkanivorans]MCS3873368.1 5'-nucleotidase/UDP-sugar diphosphatase [Chromobacterium alkanivorans]
MKLSVKPLALSLLAAGLLSACAATPGKGNYVEDKTYKITILHTNDHHGRFWPNSDSEYGLAAQKTLVDQVRAEVKAAGGYMLLLSGGDINTGVPESDLQDAEPDFRGMSRIGYDAMAVGNHEFDKPVPVLMKQRQWINFPMLSANIYQDGQRMFDPYAMFNLGGVRVAVLGLTTDDTAKMVNPEQVKGIEFRSPIAEAGKLVPELRQKADIVIAATHMGHYTDGQHGVNAPGDVEMARAVKGLDLIVGGHSQNPVCMKAENQRDDAYVPGAPCAPDRQNGAWIVQAHEWGKYVGRADFEFRNGKLKLSKYQLMPVNLKKSVKGVDGKEQKVPYTQLIEEDGKLRNFLQSYQNKGQAALDVPVGRTSAKLDGDRGVVRSQPTNLGVFIGRVMMAKVKADFAVSNSGGIRDSLPAGAINYRDVLKVFPFGSTLAYVDLNGEEALDYLKAAARMTPGAGAFGQLAGVKLRIVGGQLQQALIGGQPIDPSKTYRMAINSFIAAGGDGYPLMNKHPGYVNTGFVDAEMLREYIAAHSPIDAGAYAPGDAVTRN